MKKIIAFIAISLLISCQAFAAPWGKILHQNQSSTSCDTLVYTSYTTDGGAVPEFSRYREYGGSKFVAGDWGEICAIKVYLIDAGTSSQTMDFTIYVHDSTPDEPELSSPVGSSSDSVAGGDIAATETAVKLDMATGQLTNGTTYWVVGEADSEQNTDYLYWATADGTTELVKTVDAQDLPTAWTSRTSAKTYKFELYTQ